MSVVLSVEDLGACRKKLTIEVPAPAVEAETRRVVDEYRRQARLPGFRKGKVPSHMVRQRYGKEIEKEVVERLVPRYWKQAEAESRLEALLPPTLDEVDLQSGAGLTFVATVETRPEIEIGSLEGIDLPDPAVEPSAEEVDRALEDLRRRAGEWKPVERPAVRGDRIRGELAAIGPETAAGAEGGEAEAPQEVRFEVGDEAVWEELSLAATGKSPDQEEVFTRRQGEGEGAVERRFRLRVGAVEELEPAPLDDALAAKAGDFADLGALRADVERRLRLVKQAERRGQRERVLLDELRHRHPVELPQGAVGNEIEQMLGEYAEGLAKRGVDPQQADLDWQQLAERVKPQAERRVHARLVLDAIAAREGIEIEADELQRALGGIARQRGESVTAVRASLDRSGGLGRLRAELRREKTIKRLLGEEEESAGKAASQDDKG